VVAGALLLGACGGGDDQSGTLESPERETTTTSTTTSSTTTTSTTTTTAPTTTTTTAPPAPDPAIRGVDLRNTVYPANACEVDGWAASPPIQVVGGTGTAGNRDEELPDGSFFYAELFEPALLGYVDIDGDGREDAIVQAGCTAGGTYGDQIVMPLTLVDGMLALVGGENISAVATDAAHLNLSDGYGGFRLTRITEARLEGTSIVVDENYDATGSECNGCLSGTASVRWTWQNGWVSALA
jgi:hypothetical protein